MFNSGDWFALEFYKESFKLLLAELIVPIWVIFELMLLALELESDTSYWTFVAELISQELFEVVELGCAGDDNDLFGD